LREDGRRYGKAKHFGSLEVDDQIELRGLFHGQASRLDALEDLIDVAVCTENLSSGVVVVKSAKDGV